MDLITFLQMLDPILQNKLLYLKRMYFFFIIWEKNLIKVCFYDLLLTKTLELFKMLRAKCQQIVMILT